MRLKNTFWINQKWDFKIFTPKLLDLPKPVILLIRCQTFKLLETPHLFWPRHCYQRNLYRFISKVLQFMFLTHHGLGKLYLAVKTMVRKRKWTDSFALTIAIAKQKLHKKKALFVVGCSKHCLHWNLLDSNRSIVVKVYIIYSCNRRKNAWNASVPMWWFIKHYL